MKFSRRSLVRISGAIFALVALSGCATSKHQVQLENNALVTIGHNKAVPKKKGEIIAVPSGDTVFIEAPGYVGLLIISDSGGTTVNKVALKPADAWIGPTMSKTLNKGLDELVATVSEVQVLLSSRKGAQALERVLKLEKKYSDLEVLQLLEASCYAVQGERSKAITTVASVLRADPLNESARTFYRSLTGEEAPGSRGLSSVPTTKKKTPKAGS